MIKIQASVSKGWLHQEGGFRFERGYYFEPEKRHAQDREIDRFVRRRFGHHSIHYLESNLGQAEHISPDQVLIGGIQPNLILAAILGADFVFYPDKDMDVKGHPLEGMQGADHLPGKDELLSHELIVEFDQQIREQQSAGKHRPIPPFFWDTSGRATIHGIITTSYKLAGQEIYLDMMAQPEKVKQIHQWIADSYSVLIKHYSELGGIPATSLHVGECNGTMLSGQQYLEFVIPYAEQMGRNIGPLRMHSCGHSDHLIGGLARMENLKVIDTGSGTSVSKLRALMGKGFEIHYAPPVELLMPSSPVAEVRRWTEQLIKENNGGPMKLAYHIEPGYSEENCLLLHQLLGE